MKKKKKNKTITEIIDEMQMRREYNYATRLILGYSNKEIHGTINFRIHN
jgi:hypothetical protein